MKVIIIGGGFAGLSAAYYSAQLGYEVVLLESSSVLGGAWRPMNSERFIYPIDNGLHILSSTYKETLDLLHATGSDKLFWNIGRLNVPFVYKSKKHHLNTTLLPSPFGELLGIFLYRKLSLKSKISIIRLIGRLSKCPPDNSSTAKEYFKSEKQTDNAIKFFWEPIIVSACNAKCELVSALVVYNMLMKIFGGKTIQSDLLIPKVSVKFILHQIQNLLLKNGVEIKLNKRIESVNTENGMVTSITTVNKEIYQADVYIIATSLKAKTNFMNVIAYKNKTSFSGIINGYFLYDKPIMKEKYVSLLGTRLHWIFAEQNAGERGYLYKLTASSAEDLLDKESAAIKEVFKAEIMENIPGAKNAKLLQSQVIKESFATPVINPQFQKSRLKTKTHYNNLFLAGAHIDTGLPITIESAVISGKMAAEAVMECVKENLTSKE